MQIIAHQVITLSEVDSTNNYTANLLNTTKLAEGTVIMAHSQIAGRGQRGTVWQSNPNDNLTFSLVLYPKLLVSNQFLLSQMVALALLGAVRKFSELDAKIKWPNDILLNQKKIAGILIENTSHGEQLSTSIIGIGINVNQSEFDALPFATSLKIEMGRTLVKNEFLHALYAQLDWWYKQLCLKRFDFIKDAYTAALWRCNERAEFLINNQRVPGFIRGVDESGRLKLDVAGEMYLYDIKELAFVW